LKMQPSRDMLDSMTSSCPSGRTPETSEIPEVLLKKGSRVTKTSWRSSHASRSGGALVSGGVAVNPETARDMLRMLESHPVDPAPVEMIRPLEDCCSFFAP